MIFETNRGSLGLIAALCVGTLALFAFKLAGMI
jgi:hypothetical protein